jgi:hypothetical protein
MEQGQHPLEDLPEQLGGQAAQALLQGLGRDPKGWDPKYQLLLHQARQFGYTAELTPDEGKDEGHHHGQRQDALAQAPAPKLAQGVEGRRIDQLGQPRCHFHRRRRTGRMLAAVALDGAGMTNGAGLTGRLAC